MTKELITKYTFFSLKAFKAFFQRKVEYWRSLTFNFWWILIEYNSHRFLPRFCHVFCDFGWSMNARTRRNILSQKYIIFCHNCWLHFLAVPEHSTRNQFVLSFVPFKSYQQHLKRAACLSTHIFSNLCWSFHFQSVVHNSFPTSAFSCWVKEFLIVLTASIKFDSKLRFEGRSELSKFAAKFVTSLATT